MTGMVERVARALEAKITGKDFVSFEDAARVAIAEMRNIDLDALGAMYEAMFEDKWDCSQAPMVGAGWRAAIDAALQEGKEGE